MKYFDLSYAIKFHDDLLALDDGLKGYNQTQIAYLDSALEQIQNDDFYPTFLDKITHLIFACIKFHPFLDGNKRTSIYLGYHFANINGIFCDKEYIKAMEDIVVKVAENSLSKEDLKNNLEKIFAKSVKETTKIIHKAKK